LSDEEQKMPEVASREPSTENAGEGHDNTEGEAAASEPPAKGGKGAGHEKRKKGSSVDHKPTRSEILSRLMEKNETILKLNEENRARQDEIAELKNRWVRTAAEFENYRKRSRKEWELLKQQTKAEVILEMLGVVDDFERAFSVADQSDSEEFVQGIRLIYTNLIQVLEKFGIREVDALQKAFDPNYHMAVGQIESDDAESGAVVEVVQKGFYLDDTVIRPARVIVAK